MNAVDRIIPPGGAIGVLGGGQLGRMLAMAAAQLGLRAVVYCPDEKAPAFEVAHHVINGAYDDRAALAQFAGAADVITYEFENVPADTIAILTELNAIVRPGAMALEKAQDRLIEKTFVQTIGAQTAPFHAVDSLEDLQAGLEKIGRPAILKTRRLGYDGKGQTVIHDHDKDLPEKWSEAIAFAWEEVGAAPSILEGFVPFEREISIIAARSVSGDVVAFEPTENEHRNGILKRSSVPSNISQRTVDNAVDTSTKLLKALDYVGVIGVEFFVLTDGDLLINEFAPRVHNSGHWTSDGCSVGQFEQHIRAVAGWPLATPLRHSNAVMENLIGEEAADWKRHAASPGACVHLYGKNDMRAGRKMGHVTTLTPRV